MKGTTLYISIALLLIAGLGISCQKEQSSSEENGALVNEVIVKATIGSIDSKVSFSHDGTNKLKTAWEDDDHIIGWDESGNAIELEIVTIDDDGAAIFKKTDGSSPIPTSGTVYMIYAPGKSGSDISNKSLEYSLADQGSGKLPALMTATGVVTNNALSLTFVNSLAIVAVKNPKFQVTQATDIKGLKLSGNNILTKATFNMDGNVLKMVSSEGGVITRGCNFTTAADGTASGTMVYFAVLPNSAADEVTVSTADPEGYQISFSDKSFGAGQCYLLDGKAISKQIFAITVQDGIDNGSITTDPSDSVAWGTDVTVVASPNDGYELTPNSIIVTGASSGSIQVTDNRFTMPQDAVTVSGSFRRKQFDITAETNVGGTCTIQSGSPLTDVTSAEMGDVIKVVPTPSAGYSGGTVAVKRTDNGASVDFDNESNTFTMPPAPVTITLAFTHDIYTITTISDNVSFKKSGSDAPIAQAYYNDQIIVVTTPPSGKGLVSITVKGADNTNVIVKNGKFSMPAQNVSVTVEFCDLTGSINGHEYVLIGGKKWGKMDLGTVSDYVMGYFYSWGDTTGSDAAMTPYSPKFDSYQYASHSRGVGYDIRSASGWNPDIHDAVICSEQKWGGTWRMPTVDDFNALIADGVWVWTTDYGARRSGFLVFVAKNDADKGKVKSTSLTASYSIDSDPYIFFYVAGRCNGSGRDDNFSYYWSSTFVSVQQAWYLYLTATPPYAGAPPVATGNMSRTTGAFIRPVSD